MKNILFIGNSYTFFSDMPGAIFAPMAEKAGYPCNVTAVTAGGYYLFQFADPENEQGKRLRETIAGNHYDAVVLQDQSAGPITHKAEFLKAVGDLIALLGDQADEYVLYATWGRHPDSSDLAYYGLTNEEMTRQLAESYQLAADTYGIKVAHVGRVFEARRKAKPEEDLYDPDRTHPSKLGSTVAAEVILKTVLGDAE